MKQLLLIMNPAAGTKKANPHLPEILSVFGRAGYACTVWMTQKRGDGTALAAKYAGDADLVVCIGGDGTFNEVISGLVQSGAETPVGYIPAGSTNDFAASLGLSKNVIRAAQDIVAGQPVPYDVGRFRDRYFTYVASFGAFTKTSYATSQSVKNVLGHLAYILGGVKELSSLRRYHVRLTLEDGRQEEGDYLFGAVSNSTSVGGILTLDPEIVDMNDGQFELLLVKYPSGMGALAETIRALTTQHYDSPSLIFRTARKLLAEADPGMDWTLDGEFAKGSSRIEIENLHSAVRIMGRERQKLSGGRKP
ncbi:MAG: YegS/Rv2252/BmrU family lipid kinase [Oscillospiraceae bacterium]|jgi:lipid kinase, YegS/Rv2252/BmrU family|nr:YegS/Rv2252/BmrU family lipid kinase [Oscillospiraceae bacterium]